MEKRYYWLKLNDDFFQSKRIKKLRKIAGGDTYTIIYLKMQLKAIKTDGILTYTGLEESFSDEIALDIDEDPDNVRITCQYLLSCGLMESADDTKFFLPFVVSSTGSEGASAKRVREHRARKALQSNDDETGLLQNRYGEKEIEIEKDTEIEKEIKKERKSEGEQR